jgi:hypothetical protein
LTFEKKACSYEEEERFLLGGEVLRSLNACAAGPVRRALSRSAGGAIVVSLLATVALLGPGAPVASAAPEAGPGWSYKASFGELGFSYFETPRSPVAVDDSGNIFAANQEAGWVSIFTPTADGGAPLATISTPEGAVRNVAVDPSDGTAYIDQNFFGAAVVRRYVSDGAPTPTYFVDPTFEVPQGEGIAVDPTTGDLLVADPGAEGVRRYDSGGTLLQTIATPSIDPAWIVTAPDGSFYVAPAEGPDVTRFNGTGTQLGTISGAGSIHGLGYDASRSVVVVAVGDKLKSYSPAGALRAESSVQGGSGIGLAVDSAGLLFEHAVANLNLYLPVIAPGVEAPQVSAIGTHTVHLSAEVDPGAGPPEGSVAHFEYSADGGANWVSTPDVSAERTGTEGSDTIEADLTGLKGNFDYLVRVVAANAAPFRSTSTATPFHTLLTAPEVETGPAISITETKAELTGTIDTLGVQTTYHFEYGLTDAYGSSAPASAEAIAGNERGARSFARGISGLQPNTIYHYRLVADSSEGEGVGADRTFTTAGAGVVRAYERVSPAAKMGGAISSFYIMQAAPDGSAAAYTLAAAPANAESAVMQTRMLSRRAPDGWRDWQPLDPPQKASPSIVQAVTSAISPDFTQAMVISSRALTAVGQNGPFTGGGNVYIKDLNTGEYTFVGGAPGAFAYSRMTGLQTANMYLGGSPDFSWVIFAAPVPLVGTGTSAPALYKWSREGGLEVESRLPGTNAIAAGEVRRPNAKAEPWTFRSSSADGETMYFSLTGSEAGVFRRSGDQTVAISVSHISADDPMIVHEGVFDGASSDGRYAFFHTGTPLTEDTPPGEPGQYLYRYDTSSNDLVFIAGSVIGAGYIWGVGEDGKTVYFQRNQNGLGSFAWREGVTHRVTPSPLPVNDSSVFISPSGRFMGYSEVDRSLHLYDADKEEEVCVSCSAQGNEGALPTAEGRALSNHPPEVVNDEGTMFFDSKNPLLADDHNVTSDVYQYRDGRLTLISPGDGPYSASFGDATPDAGNIFFTTNQSLVSGDNDGSIDVYDARVGGGFPEEAGARTPCEGESCRSPIGAPPPLPANKPGGNAAAPFSISKVRKLTAADRKSLAVGGKAQLKLTVSHPGTVTLSGMAKIGGTKKKIVTASAKAKRAGDIAIPFALSKGALAELNRRGSLPITLRVGFGNAKPKAVHLTLKAVADKKGGRS